MSISSYDIQNIESIISGTGDWFTAHLLRLMAHADKDNLRRLGEAYPDVFTYFCAWRYGAVPAEYASSDDIREYVNNSGVSWLKDGNTYKVISLTNRKDF
jgi:hypothetical protein